MRAKAAEERLATLQTEKFALEDQLMDSRRAWASETQRCVNRGQVWLRVTDILPYHSRSLHIITTPSLAPYVLPAADFNWCCVVRQA